MIDPNTFTNARYRRLLALAEIQEKMAVVEQREVEMHNELMAAAPEGIRPYLEDESVIKFLLQYGEFDDKMSYYENPHGLTNARKTRAAFNALKQAWRNTIEIEYGTGNPRQMEVRIAIVR